MQSLFPLLECIQNPVCRFNSASEKDSVQSDSPPEAFDAKGTTNVSLFVDSLRIMLMANPVNMKVFDLNDGPAILGVLLTKVSAEKLRHNPPPLRLPNLFIHHDFKYSTNILFKYNCGRLPRICFTSILLLYLCK